MTDMTAVIVPKSDQMNADDLIPGPRTITITRVDVRPGSEQPVSIFFEEDNGKPWKPCKSMARVLVHAWGPDAKAYEGRAVTLYRDPSVKWGGMQVGGIRISHMSHIDRDMVIALTETKGKRAPFQVRVLREASRPAPAPAATLEARADKFEQALRAAADARALAKIWDNGAGLRADLSANNAERAAEIERLHVMLDAELSTPPAYADDFPGDRP
ncbi:MAG TPA: hypothetical protein VGN74_05415 [Brevundimonas sp.]|jgi:cytochrome c556|uniref:hypothetical protein n=1 Tax=Brevundimonas sp. TaxID=1871086 RepID=UPI002E0D3A81|nr:hypothetical protein [Brevundimonas sp.]